MKKISFVIAFFIGFIIFSSCARPCMCKCSPDSPTGVIYIKGDSSKKIFITYYSQSKNVTDSVQLPFATIPQYCGSDNDINNAILKICDSAAENVKAVIIGNKDVIMSNGCPITTYLAFYPYNGIASTGLCKGITDDSILNYLKTINYGGYLEINKSDTCKTVYPTK